MEGDVIMVQELFRFEPAAPGGGGLRPTGIAASFGRAAEPNGW
jgi:hypothetical protein